jgi:hypothetical protein
MLLLLRRPGGARVTQTAKMGPTTLQNVEKLKFDKGIDKETNREKSR